jgi:exosortase A
MGCTIVLLVTAYWSTASVLAEQWSTSTYSHAVLVLPLGLYLGWRRRGQLASLTPDPSLWMVIWIGVLAFVWLLGVLTSTGVVQHFCLVAMLVSLIWGQIGSRAARVLSMPLLFLFFAVPMGDSLIPLLQDFSAWFAVKLLQLTRVPVLLEGRIITIPSGRWEVAEACSGIHYLLASLTIGFVYADLVYQKWMRKVAFLIASALVPVLANGLRVYGILLTDYLGGTRLARSEDHILAGWVFLSIITILLFFLGMRWQEEAPSQPMKDSSDDGELTGRVSTAKKVKASVQRLVLFASLGLMVAGVAPLAAKLLSQTSQGVSAGNLQTPKISLPWSPTGEDLSGWRPAILAPDAELAQVYKWQDRCVKLYVAYHEPGVRNAKLVSSSNSLFDRIRWQWIGERGAEATIDGKTVRVRQTSIRSADASLVLWNWYWVDGKFTSNEFEAKWLLAKSRITRSPLGSAMIVIATDERAGDSSAADILSNFVSHFSMSEPLHKVPIRSDNPSMN